MADRRRIFRQNFREDDYNWPSAKFRIKLLFDPYKFGFYLGKYGWPGGQKSQGFTPGEFSWMAKWAFRGGLIMIPVMLYNFYHALIDTGAPAWKVLPGLILFGFGTWWAYNLRRGFRNGLTARIAEEEALGHHR